MESINRLDLMTIIKLSETVPNYENENRKVTYKEFYGEEINHDYYKSLGQALIKTIQTKEEYKWLSDLDYEWVLQNEHPLSNFSPLYRNKKQQTSINPKNTIVDLFSGAGGMSLGFIQEDYEVSFANDIEESCVKTYIHNHPSIPHENVVLGDIDLVLSKIKSHLRFENTDVVIGGPPCQGFSMANRQRIKDDPRNKLYKRFIEAVNELQPKVFVMENVKGMLNVANQVVEDFKEAGYFTSYTVLNAKDYGIPQNRERIFFVGTKNLEDSYKIIENIKNKKVYKKTFYLQDALYGLPKLEASRTKNATTIYDKSGGLVLPKVNKKSNDYINQINNNKETFVILNGKARYNNDRDIEIYSRLKQGEDSTSESIADIMPYASRNHIFKDKYYKLKEYDFCKTITAHMQYDCNMYIHPNQSRGLTPREAARVQSYPDNYFFLGPYTKTYMQIGNSVPPMLSRIFAQEIKEYLRG